MVGRFVASSATTLRYCLLVHRLLPGALHTPCNRAHCPQPCLARKHKVVHLRPGSLQSRQLPPLVCSCLQVDYADGEQEEEVLALQRVRLLVHAGEELPLASGSSLAATMGVLRRLLQGSEFARDPGRKRLLQRLEELTAYAKRRYGEQVFEEEMLRSVTLASSPGFAAATAHTSARSGAGCRGAGATSGGRVSCGGSGGVEAIHRALALATQLPANIKINSTKPPDATRHTWTLKVCVLLLIYQVKRVWC